jgi:2-dehydro-3-deoxyphosphogalactonate aldolase
MPVGGVGAHNVAAYRQAGAVGAGVGSSLYSPGVSLDELAARAERLLQAWHAA